LKSILTRRLREAGALLRATLAADPAPTAPPASAAPNPAGDGAPHYVRDYQAYVANLKANLSNDAAMEAAVGGAFDIIGKVERAILDYAGLRDGMSLVDIGCGSGRLASNLSDLRIDYLGTDVVQDLLDHARTRANRSFRFVRHTDLTLPVPDSSIDIACAFSVFTHLRHEETFLYLADIRRALKPGGKLVLSFLEFAVPAHWAVFEATVNAARAGHQPHLNTFIESDAIRVWAAHVGLTVDEIVPGTSAPWRGQPLGQSVAFLRKE
jgi:SAM-dependent methyltransferase